MRLHESRRPHSANLTEEGSSKNEDCVPAGPVFASRPFEDYTSFVSKSFGRTQGSEDGPGFLGDFGSARLETIDE